MNSKQGTPAIDPGRWFGRHTPAPEQSDEQMLAMMQAFSAAHNKRIKQG